PESHSPTQGQASVFAICGICRGRTADPKDGGPRYVRVHATLVHFRYNPPIDFSQSTRAARGGHEIPQNLDIPHSGDGVDPCPVCLGATENCSADLEVGTC